MGDQLFDELHGIRRQEALRFPGSDGPSSDRRSAMHHRPGPTSPRGIPYRREPRQCRGRPANAISVWGTTLSSSTAGGCARSGRQPRTSHATRSASEPQQRFVGKLRHFEHRTTAQAVAPRQHGQSVHWMKQSAAKRSSPPALGDVDVAALKATRQAGAAILHQVDLDAGVAFAVTRQKIASRFSMTCGVAPTRSTPASPALSALARRPSASRRITAADCASTGPRPPTSAARSGRSARTAASPTHPRAPGFAATPPTGSDSAVRPRARNRHCRRSRRRCGGTAGSWRTHSNLSSIIRP